jgi:hypothetical protein
VDTTSEFPELLPEDADQAGCSNHSAGLRRELTVHGGTSNAYVYGLQAER